MELDNEDNLADVGKLSRDEYLQQLKKSDPQFYPTMMQSSDVMDLMSSSEEEGKKEGEIFTPDKLEVSYVLFITVVVETVFPGKQLFRRPFLKLEGLLRLW